MAECIIDATESKSVDWAELRALYVKGISLSDLSKKFGISYNTIRSRSAREKWCNTVAHAQESIAQAATETMVAASTKHLLRMSGIADIALNEVEKTLQASPDLDALEQLARIADTFDRVARRTYRLDEEDTKRGQLMLNVNLSGMAGAQLLPARCLDLAAIPVKADAADAV